MDENIKELEKKRNFLFSAQSLASVLSSARNMERAERIKALQEKQIPVLHSAEEFERFVGKYPNYLIAPYFLFKEEPTDLLLSTSSMHMNWLWPNLLYVPLNIGKENCTGIGAVYRTALKHYNIVFFNHTIPHKSNPVMQEMFGPGNGDYLIRKEKTFIMSEGNGQAFVTMASQLMKNDDFTDVTVVLVGVGGAGTLAAKAIRREKNPKRLILVDIENKSGLAAELDAEFFQKMDDLPDLSGQKLVTIDATAHFEKELQHSVFVDFVKDYDSPENVFIDYNMNTPAEAYQGLKTRCGVGKEYVAITNYIMAQKMIQGAASIGVTLPPISKETFDTTVAKSVHIRDQIKYLLN